MLHLAASRVQQIRLVLPMPVDAHRAMVVSQVLDHQCVHNVQGGHTVQLKYASSVHQDFIVLLAALLPFHALLGSTAQLHLLSV